MEEEREEIAPEDEEEGTPDEQAQESNTGQRAPANIEMLLDIPLSIQVRLGETRLPLRDVLNLSAGSTLRLNRSENEPVELYVNGKLIATGQVIQTPEGNVGVEVSTIVTRAERIRSFS
jgi:flagellar motor switch protein FliN/FliY